MIELLYILLKMKEMWLGAQTIRGLDARLEYFSRKMQGIPYLLGPMGESYLDSIETKLEVMQAHSIAGVAEWCLGMESSDVWGVIADYMEK